MNSGTKYFNADGTPTVAMLTLWSDLQRKLDAIAAVPAASGGATVDTQARAAIAALIAAAQ